MKGLVPPAQICSDLLAAHGAEETAHHLLPGGGHLLHVGAGRFAEATILLNRRALPDLQPFQRSSLSP